MYVFFAGGGAAKFLKDWQAAGLKGKIPLYGSGFLTDGILEAAGDAAEGLETTLHYADGIDTPRNKAFRDAYAKAYKLAPRRLRGAGLRRRPVAGRRRSRRSRATCAKKKELIAAMEKAKIDSPRGKWTLSKAHNPVQDMYLRKVSARRTG